MEPTPWVTQLLSLPVGLIFPLARGALWMTLTPIGRGPAPSLGECIGALLTIVPAHETLQLVMHPRTGDSIIGFWPSPLIFYTHYHNHLR